MVKVKCYKFTIGQSVNESKLIVPCRQWIRQWHTATEVREFRL